MSDAVTRTASALLTVALLRTYATSLNGFALTVAVTLAWWVGVIIAAFSWIFFRSEPEPHGPPRFGGGAIG